MKSQVIDQVLEQDLTDLSRTRRLVHSSLKITFVVAHDFFQHLVKLRAMALSFKTLLSLAPLLAVIFSLLKGFGVHNRMEPALAEALEPLGEKGREITANLIGFVDKMSAGALGSIGVIALFLTVLSLSGTIEEAFNQIWRVKSSRRRPASSANHPMATSTFAEKSLEDGAETFLDVTRQRSFSELVGVQVHTGIFYRPTDL